ncbi:MAG TPA: fibronectin type III domain-containing protein, partial [Lachnospiraceae bacterium]|nr:fibronectin type III domain-containing protein [Lachnospiraceae bacterium]
LPIAIYDGTRLLIEGTDYTLAYHNNDKLGDATVVIQGINRYNDTISYDFSIQKEAVSQPVTVYKPQVRMIQIAQLPSNVHYIEGETLDSSGLALAIKYDNGSSDIITGGFTINDTSLSKVGTKVISVSYQGYVATFEVYVREKQVIQVEKVTDPTKLQYNVGDTLNTAGLSLKVRYDNKEEKTIDTGYSVNTTLLNTPGKISVKVTYQDKSVYFTVTVMPKNVEDVKVEALTKNSAKVKWEKQSKVSGYQVYMATSEKGKYVKVATVAGTKTAYTVKKLEESKTYYFKVRSYKVVDGVKKYGKYSTIAVREGK